MSTPILDLQEFEAETSWQEEPTSVRTLAKTLALPLIVKLDTGLYDNYGAGTDLDTTHPYLLHSLHRGRRVVGANVVWDRQTKTFVESGACLSIPVLYPGWFQPLSENIQRKNESSSTNYDSLRVTIREVAEANIKAFLSQADVTGIHMPPGSHIKSYEKYLCPPGEIFMVSGVFVEKVAQPSVATQLLTWMCQRRQKESVTTKLYYLQCCTSYGVELLLPFETVGKFYEVGLPGTKDPRCVYQMQNLISFIDMESKKNFIARLIYGKHPMKHDTFSGIVKLEEIVLQDSILACSMGEILPTLMEFPLHSSLSFLCAAEQSEKVGKFANDVYNYMDDNLHDYLSRMKVVQKVPDGTSTSTKFKTCKLSIKRNLPPLPRSTHDDTLTDRTEECSFDESYITDTEFTDDSDYDFIPVDDPLYQNQGDAVGVTQEGNFYGTARKLQAELLARNSVVAKNGNIPDLYAIPMKKPTKSDRDSSCQHSDATGVDNTLTSTNTILMDDTLSNQAINDFLDSVFDYDTVSVSTHSGHKIQGNSRASQVQGEEVVNSSLENQDQVSDLSSLYKKIPRTKYIATSDPRLDSGLGDTPRCSESSCCDTTPRILHLQLSDGGGRSLRLSDVTAMNSWTPPDDIGEMSVEDVARSLRYIGLKAQHINHFLEEQIDGRQLKELNEELLKEGFPALNALDRKKLLDFKSGWRPKRQTDSII